MTITDAAPVEPPVTAPPRTPSTRTWLVGFGLLLLASVAGGLVWAALAPQLHFLVTTGGPFPISEDVAGQIVSADGWFAVISVVLGLLAGAAGLATMSRFGPLAAPIAAVAAVVGVSIAFLVGQVVANHRIVWVWNPTAGDNHEVVGPLVLQVWGVVVIAPVVAVLVVLIGSIFHDGPARRA